MVSRGIESPIPNWVTYPGDTWETITPEEAGFEIDRWNRWLAEQNPLGASIGGESHPGNEWGAVIVRGGYVVKTWGDPNYRSNSASVGKCFTRLCLQIAMDKGLISSADALIQDYWTGEGQLNNPDKYLDKGFHRTLSFRHLATLTGGFPVTNGYDWRHGRYPDWANPHGNDPDRANYAHRMPGVGIHYSSGGFWRCSQALTKVLGKDLKCILDEILFGKIGISANRWDWLTGRYVRETRHFYPEWPGYGDFLDSPYEIEGELVRGGAGWVVMSPYDLARIGLFLATGGVWKGERLIGSPEFFTRAQSYPVRGWGGGNNSTLSAWSGDQMLVIASVTTQGLDWQEIPFVTDLPIRVSSAE